MGCRELDITSYYRFVSTQCTPKKSHSRAQTSYCTQKNTYMYRRIDESQKAYSGFSHTVVSGYRYYDADMGRWINRDPIAESGGNNLYGFVGNDAINGWDRLGLEVTASFSQLGCKGLFVVTDNKTKTTAKAIGFSGGGCSKIKGKKSVFYHSNGLKEGESGGVIPKGEWLIVDEPSGVNKGNWFALFKKDNLINDKTGSLPTRSGFRLHLGSFSKGCLTICRWEPNAQIKWNNIKKIIKSTKIKRIIDYGTKLLRIYGELTVK